MSDSQKLCCICSADVAHAKRVKDAKGRYYCQSCYDKAAAGRGKPTANAAVGSGAVAMPVAPPPVADIPLATAASIVPPSPPASPPAPAPVSDSGDYDLAEPILPKKAPADEPKLACASCKRIFPEKQARIDDGEFLCPACFAKRRGATGGRPVAAAAPTDTEVMADVAWSLGKQALIAGIVAFIALVACITLNVVLPPGVEKGDEAPEVVGLVIRGLLNWVGVIIQAFLLMVSMVVVAKMLGGVDFGEVGTACAKSIGTLGGMFILQHVVNYFAPDAGMFLYMFWSGAYFIAFMAVFRLDAFEAILLSVINMVIGWIFTIFVIGALFTML